MRVTRVQETNKLLIIYDRHFEVKISSPRRKEGGGRVINEIEAVRFVAIYCYEILKRYEFYTTPDKFAKCSSNFLSPGPNVISFVNPSPNCRLIPVSEYSFFIAVFFLLCHAREGTRSYVEGSNT